MGSVVEWEFVLRWEVGVVRVWVLGGSSEIERGRWLMIGVIYWGGDKGEGIGSSVLFLNLQLDLKNHSV